MGRTKVRSGGQQAHKLLAWADHLAVASRFDLAQTPGSVVGVVLVRASRGQLVAAGETVIDATEPRNACPAVSSRHFDTLLEAQVLIEDWRTDDNTHRPHSAHGDLTPNEFAQAWATRHQPALA